MTIETIFKPLDNIFFIVNKKVINSTVRGIKIEVRRPAQGAVNTEITYLCGDEEEKNVHIKVSQIDAFKSKEELLKSL